MSSRINSTWGGNLVDMVRCRKFIEIVREEDLAGNIAQRGAELVAALRSLARETGGFTNVRGVGSLVAFDVETAEARKDLLDRMYANRLLALASGVRSVRFRLPLVVRAEEIDRLVELVAASL
jgi:L-lysine 6-transaminase